MSRPDDRGLATVWAAAGVAVLMAVLLLGLYLGSAVVARHRAASAADLGALAGAADAVLGPTAACDRAGRVVVAAGAELTGCALDGWDVLVEVRVRVPLRPGPVLGVPSTASARARAGPAVPDGNDRSPAAAGRREVPIRLDRAVQRRSPPPAASQASDPRRRASPCQETCAAPNGPR